MKREQIATSGTALLEVAPGWTGNRTLAAVLSLAVIFWLLGWYWPTAQSIVAIWERSETFAHGYIIVPISAWLIWQRRDELARVELRPDFRIPPLLALVGFGWLLGQLAGAGVVQQYAMVLMIPLMVWAILGEQVARTIVFPLAFLLFAVPFGEFLEQPMMEYTADFTVHALRASGIPVYREGLFFTLPSGSWSVVEACSGLRYLIASLTLGCLYAYLTYRSFARRALFIVASLIVPIVANWLRAYMIVMIGHLSGMTLAVGVDHLIYGWVFFGIVMLVLFWAGSFWREDVADYGAAPASGLRAVPPRPALAGIGVAAVVAAATVALWPAAAARLAGTGANSAIPLESPLATGGWQPAAGRLSTWTPRFLVPSARVDQLYAKDAMRVGVHIGYYRSQRQDHQLISSQNALVSTTDRDWANTGESTQSRVLAGQDVPLIEGKLRARNGYLLVWRWYWVDGRYVVNPYWAKLLQAKAMLLGRGDDGAVVMLYAPYGDQPQPAAQALQAFADAMLPAITRSLEHARRAQPRP